jgi:adenine-specific DNA-methyltransferase
MPEIVFKGKEYVYNHHLTVPYRPLLVDKAKGIGHGDLASNLVIHGDNLHALKSLLPRYAGKVDLVFIDPPYNTGNEGWCYNDNVNSPIMREWLSTNPVDGEDMLRHDKWLCLMWPRLVLLRELLKPEGLLLMSLDDNEQHHARAIGTEIFGEESYLGQFVWKSRQNKDNRNENGLSVDHEYILAFGSAIRGVRRDAEQFSNSDNDPRGPWVSSNMVGLATKENRPNLHFELKNPVTEISYSSPYMGWRYGTERMNKLIEENRILWPTSIDGRPREKVFLSDMAERTNASSVIDLPIFTRDGTLELEQILGNRDFSFPKPSDLIEYLVEISTAQDALILDSFAGSGTTAHAVLKANARDGGSRRFILVEGEDYADRLTAERVRRAIKGYAWVGTQREELLREKITYSQFKKADEWLAKIAAIKAKEGFAETDNVGWIKAQRAESTNAPVDSQLTLLNPPYDDSSVIPAQAGIQPETNTGAQSAPLDSRLRGNDRVKKRFDKINVKMDDGVLLVEGEKRISQMVEGLGGEFTYCTLGEPLDVEKLLAGENMPAFDALGAWLFHTATGGTLLPPPSNAPEWYLGEALDAHVWLMYQPDVNFLKSPEAALTLSRAKAIAEWGRARGDGKRHLVFAPAKYMSNKQLSEHGIDYAPLPFALYREG